MKLVIISYESGEEFFQMRNRLQYLYSISVLAGVLVTAYLMIDRENMRQMTARNTIDTTASLRQEASASDPALNQLFQMEEELAQLKKDKDKAKERVPTFTK